MRSRLVFGAVGFGLLLANLTSIPAFATGNTLYVAASGSVGVGTSCASAGYVGGAGIASAVSAATDGDTIILCDGTFSVSSQIFIDNKELIISGANSAANTIINGSTSTNGVFKIISTKSVKVEKVTFFAGYNTGPGGVLYMSLRPSQSLSTTRHVITNNIFAQNRSNDQGGAIFAEGDNMGTGDFAGILTISNNTFIENHAAVDGGAIVMAAVAFDETKIIIESNKFLYNRAAGRAGGAVVSNFNTLTSLDNIYYLNTTGDTGNSETLYGRIKIGGDILMNNLTAGRRDCRLEDLSPTITRTTRVDNPYCLAFDDTQVPSLTTITRSEGLALTGTFLPQSPAVTSSSVTSTSAALTLATRDSGGGSITQYSYSLDGTSYANFPAGGGGTQTITGLSANTSYSVRLKATSSAGTSYASEAHSFTTAAQPADAPTIVSLTGGDLSLTINFTLGSDNGDPIFDLSYSLDGGGYISAGTITSPITISSLSGRTNYSVKIKSENSRGLSSESNLRSAQTLDLTQDAADAAAAIESRKVAQAQRDKEVADARSRVLKAVRENIAPSKSDLISAEFQAVGIETIQQMLEVISIFARGESTTAGDLVLAAKAVHVMEKLSDETSAKRVSTQELRTIGLEAFASNFKTQVLRGLIATPLADRMTMVGIKEVADTLLSELIERRKRVSQIIDKIAARGDVQP